MVINMRTDEITMTGAEYSDLMADFVKQDEMIQGNEDIIAHLKSQVKNQELQIKTFRKQIEDLQMRLTIAQDDFNTINADNRKMKTELAREKKRRNSADALDAVEVLLNDFYDHTYKVIDEGRK